MMNAVWKAVAGVDIGLLMGTACVDMAKLSLSKQLKFLALNVSQSAPKVRLGEVNDLISAAAHHGLDHEECEALRHLKRDGWRHHEL